MGELAAPAHRVQPAVSSGAPPRIAVVDVGYRGTVALAAAAAVQGWTAVEPSWTAVHRTSVSAPYVPGAFRLRELAPVLAAIDLLGRRAPGTDISLVSFDVVVIDGYVWLGSALPGLGHAVFAALGEGVPVVGVAKNPYRGNDQAAEVLRGVSRRPLYVTAIGIDVGDAVTGVRSMAGAHRIPAVLKQVDRLSRRFDGADADPIDDRCAEA